jgi:hypothetical protein
MFTRFVLLSVCLASLNAAAFGQEYVTKQEFSAAIEKLSNQIAALGAVPSPSPVLENRVANLERGQDDIRIVQQDQGVVLGQISKRGDNGEYHWRFDTNSQSARDEFKRAMKSSIPRNGIVLIHNESRYDRDVVVNGFQYRVMAGAKLPVPVPVGTVSTRTIGDRTKYWTLDINNDYQMTLHVIDQSWPVVVQPIQQIAAY